MPGGAGDHPKLITSRTTSPLDAGPETILLESGTADGREKNGPCSFPAARCRNAVKPTQINSEASLQCVTTETETEGEVGMGWWGGGERGGERQRDGEREREREGGERKREVGGE